MTADKELMLMPLFLAAEGRGDPLFVLVLVLTVSPLSFGTVCSYMVDFKNGENEKDVFPNERQ